jgi:hypothetical protein
MTLYLLTSLVGCLPWATKAKKNTSPPPGKVGTATQTAININTQTYGILPSVRVSGLTLTINPLSLSFGSTPIGTPLTLGINVCDTTDSKCTIPALFPITNIGVTPAADTVDASNPFSSQTNCPASLNPGAVCTVTVTFNPIAASTYSNGTLVISYNGAGSPVSVPLTGTGTSPTVPTLSSVAISPTSATITTGATQSYILTGTYSDSSTKVLGNGGTGVRWSVTGGSAATVTFDAGGLCTTGFATSNPCTARTVTVGDFIGAVESAPPGDTLTCSDTLGDTFSYTANFSGTSLQQFCIASAKATGSNTISLGQSGSGNEYGFDFQFTGTNGATQDNGLPSGIALVNPGAATNAVTTGNFTLSSAGDLIISYLRDVGSTAFTAGSGYTYLGGSQANGCNTNVTLCVEYKLGASSGTNAATWTDSASTTSWRVGAMAITVGTSQVATINQQGTVTPTTTGTTTVYGNSGSITQKDLCASAASGVTSLTCQIAYNTAKDTNVILIGWNDATAAISSVSDSSGNTYTLSSAHTQGNGLSSYIYYSQGILASGLNTITVNWSGGGATTPSIQIFELGGLIGGVDTAGAANTSTALCQPSAITTTNQYDIGIGFAVTGLGQVVSSVPPNGPDGGTIFQGNDSNGNSAVILDTFATVSAAQPLYATASSGPCAMAEVFFKTAGASTGLTISGAASGAYTRDNPPLDTYEWYPNSLFTTPIPGTPTNHLIANSDTIVSNIFAGNVSGSYATIWRYDNTYPFDQINRPNYYSGCGDPLYHVTTVARQTTIAKYQMQNTFFHAVAGASMMNGGGSGTGGDQSMMVWDQCLNGTETNTLIGGAIYEFYTTGSHLQLSPACNAVTQAQSLANANCAVAVDCGAMGFPQSEPNPIGVDTYGCSSSMGTAPSYGTLRNAELINGVINHALILNVNCVGGPGVYPGTGGTNQLCTAIGFANNTNRPVNGNHLFIDSSYSCSSLPVWQRGVCVAMQVYGGYISDTGEQSASALVVSRVDAQGPWILTSPAFPASLTPPDPLMTWWLAQTTSCTSSPTCTGTNGLQTYGTTGNPTEVVAPFFNMPGLLGHLHILNPCVDEFVTGAPGGCNPN